MRKNTLAAVSRVEGEGLGGGGPVRRAMQLCVEPQCRAGKDQMEKEGWRQMESQPLREHSAERLWPYLLKNLPRGII